MAKEPLNPEFKKNPFGISMTNAKKAELKEMAYRVGEPLATYIMGGANMRLEYDRKRLGIN